MLLVLVTAAAVTVVLRALPAHTEPSAPAQRAIPPFSVCSKNVDIASLLPGGANVDPDIVAANAYFDSTESDLIQQVSSAGRLDQYRQITLLGKLAIFDKTLSPAKNVACESCHAHYVGFTGASSILNATIVAQPGSATVMNAVSPAPAYRLSARKPQSYAYAAFAPILHYNAAQGDFYGGNFWDMRATGVRLGNPAAEQAEGPPTNPLEMANPDSACFVWKISQRPYRSIVEALWGAQSFAINWPTNIESVCAKPGPPPQHDPYPVHLSPNNRAQSNSTFDHIAVAMATYESSPDVSPFSSKFDAYLAGKAQLTPEEKRGYELFNGKAHCNQCHSSGAAVNGGNQKAADVAPLFTDFTSANLGLPRNLALPFYCESKPDQSGYVANPQGFDYKDLGVGATLAGSNNPNPAEWQQLAPQFNGKFRVPTLRDVDMRPRPDFLKAYMHNGYLKSLQEVVHFYNTSEVLPTCAQGSPGEKVTCWPEPEVPENVTQKIGNLGLTDEEEDDVVSFLKTLTDGFVPTSDTNAARKNNSSPEHGTLHKARKEEEKSQWEAMDGIL
jgi:cytochrome c peroxidase